MSEQISSSEPMSSEQKKEVLYDSGGVQRVPLRVEHNDKRYDIAHIFNPVTDDLLKEYDRRRDVRILESQEVRNASEVVSDSFGAAVWLWNELCTGVEGIGEPNAPLPEDWKSRIPDADKVAAIDDALLACEVVDLPVADQGEFLPWGYSDETRTIKLRALFAGYEVETAHVLRKASAKVMAEYNSIMTSKLIVKGTKIGKTDTRLSPRSGRLGKLYDQLAESQTGYTGAPPLHHKLVIVLEHCGSEQETTTKN